MYKRIIDIENKLDEGMFLFGARLTLTEKGCHFLDS